MFQRKFNNSFILSALQDSWSQDSNQSDQMMQIYSSMLTKFSTEELPKKIAFTANLGIIQYLKNQKQQAFHNLSIVKSMI